MAPPLPGGRRDVQEVVAIPRTSGLYRSLAYLRKGPLSAEGWSEESVRDRNWERVYRDRWQHDREVRTTHGVNCTGSCSWKVYIKDGLIVWETQETDYPSLGPDTPEYEPRGCPRGASFSWYAYSPLRVKYPYVRGVLLNLWREARKGGQDPVAAWASIVEDPEKVKLYRSARGKGGLVRSTWAEVTEMIAAATIHTIKRWGPDRVVGFTPIPAMSMVSYASGVRFLSLIGGTVLSFYDWFADLPIASPQIWGEQTDVPESGDWYNAAYMIIWGTNLPQTRTPDAHFMVETRYHGTKIAAVSPDYAEYVKFSDTWLPARPGTDGALAMAMTHVVLREFYVEHPCDYFLGYARRFTDLPFLVLLREASAGGKAGYAPDRFLNMADLGLEAERAEWKPLVWDEGQDKPLAPNGTIGYRWDGSGRWNLGLESPDGKEIEPELTFLHGPDGTLPVLFPYFGDGERQVLLRHAPVRRLRTKDGDLIVATVYDLMLANVGIARGLSGDYPKDYDDPTPYTPAWQEAITGVPRGQAIAVAREFADTAARTRGRAMIAMGAGVNHWYHSDMTYRAILNLVLLTGGEGVNGGGWAHYVGQEKIRPLEGFSTLAFASDWLPATRWQNGTSFFYFATEQYRYDDTKLLDVSSPLGGRFANLHAADMNALAVRLGWLPSYPQFNESSLEVAKEAETAGCATDEEVARHVAERLQKGDLRFAVENPSEPENFPRVLFVWRGNLLTSNGKGYEYFREHLLGAGGHILAEPKDDPGLHTVQLKEPAPRGKLDLLVDIDFRMTGTGLFSDIVLPAATWYEKHDISTTDMHPYIHPFTPAISPPWEARSDWGTFSEIARVFTRLAKEHLAPQQDLMMAPLLHDTQAELAQPLGKVRDWRTGETDPVPGRTMPRFFLLPRDFSLVYDRMITLGPRAVQQSAKGVVSSAEEAYGQLLAALGPSPAKGVPKGPSLADDRNAAEAILRLSGTTNGRRAVAAWHALEKTTGLTLAQLADGREQEFFSFNDLVAQPRLTITAPTWSGIETHERRYSPFTSNVDFGIPWRTVTGRQQFYMDHEVMLDFGEGLPLYRPPLERPPFPKGSEGPAQERPQVTLRFLTPHNKWSIHTTYGDTLTMLSLFRGGPVIWLSPKDAEAIGVRDNDWVEVFNRNGATAVRAVVSHRIPVGVSIMYHAPDQTVAIPATAVTGDRGGVHNSMTRIVPKPTHMIGGYAQFSYGFNYYGPCGHQRDEFVVVRRLGEVRWLVD